MEKQIALTEISRECEKDISAPDCSERKELTVSEPKIQQGGITMWNNTVVFNQAYKMAQIVAQSDIVPPAYKNKTGNCLLAIDIANRMGLSPLSVMQNSQVVQNKFSWTGSACKSMIDSCGKYKSTRYVMVGKKNTDTWGYYLQATTKDGSIIDGVCVTVQMAKAEEWYSRNPKWKSMTELMLKYRSAAFFMRTECASLAMGFLTAEENEDIEAANEKSNKISLKEAIDSEEGGQSNG